MEKTLWIWSYFLFTFFFCFCLVGVGDDKRSGIPYTVVIAPSVIGTGWEVQ